MSNCSKSYNIVLKEDLFDIKVKYEGNIYIGGEILKVKYWEMKCMNKLETFYNFGRPYVELTLRQEGRVRIVRTRSN